MPNYTITTPDKIARTTGLDNQTVANASRAVGAEIDNATNKDDLLDLEISYSFPAAPAAGKSCELWLLHDMGRGYEPGDAATDPGSKARLVTAWSPRADRSTDKFFITDYPIAHYKFKLLVRNVDVGQTMTVTVYAATGKMAQIAG